MSNISEVVDVQISNDTVTPTQQGFGTPLLLQYHTHNVDRVREYTDLDGLVADGFGTDEPAYKMAAKFFSQNPRVESVKVGRLTTSVAHTVELTMTNATEGAVVSLTIDDQDGNSTAITYTVLAAATTTTVATAVELLVEAVTGVSSTAASAVVTAVGTSGKVFWYKDLVNVTFKDVTPNASIDDDLTLIENADDDWYEINSALNSETNVDDIAAWVETRDKIFGASTADELELTSGGTLGSGLAALNYDHTFVIWNGEPINYAAAAWAGRMLPYEPGSATWANKDMSGVVADSLSATERGFLDGDSMNYYTTVAGLDITRKGVMASGEYIDVIVGIHWIKARIAEEVFSAIASAPKIPFTDKGVALIVGIVRSVLLKAAARNIITAESIQVSAPLVADIATADRTARLLPDVKFSATLQGAIHKTSIRGSLTV
jgi:hypothetical protein